VAATSLCVAFASPDRQQGEKLERSLRASGVSVLMGAGEAADLADSLNGKRPDAVLVRCDQQAFAETAVRILRERLPDTPVVVISTTVTASGVRRTLDAGGGGVLLDSDIESALPAVLEAVCAGQVCVPRVLGVPLSRPALSHREKQILGMVVLGFTNGEIAMRLHLAESTIKSHLSSAFPKLGVRSRAQAAALILDPEEGLGPGILAISDPATPVGV
jgi:DNA-binding NarL/FixJ family response regulator